MVRKGSTVRVRQRASYKVPADAGILFFRGRLPLGPLGTRWVRTGPVAPVRRGPRQSVVGTFGGVLAPFQATVLAEMAQLELPFPKGPEAHGEPQWLTIAEAADSVRCCERTIRRAIDSGALRAGRIRGARGSRGTVRIRPEDIAEWLFEEEG